MLKIVKNPTFRVEAVLNVPTDEGIVEQSVQAKFRMLASEDLIDGNFAQFVDRALIDVSGIEDENGKSLDWTDAVKKQCMQFPWFFMGLFNAYAHALNGNKLGN